MAHCHFAAGHCSGRYCGIKIYLLTSQFSFPAFTIDKVKLKIHFVCSLLSYLQKIKNLSVRSDDRHATAIE